MNILLPPYYHKKKYGIDVRLVNEDDTDFILSLRSNSFLTRFIHSTENNRDKQIEWIRNYKIREAEGREYYFIYSKNNEPIGLNRISNIFQYYGTTGSWLCRPGIDPEDSLSTYFLCHDIIFEDINLDLSIFDVRKANTHVWKLHKKAGAIIIGESDIDYYFSMNRTDYFQRREKLIELFNLNQH